MATDRNESLEERMENLSKRLATAQPEVEENDTSDENTRAGYSQALKISSEFISAVVVGAMLGYLLDLVLPTKPWGLVVFLLIGFCAGVLNVLRVVGKVSEPHPVDKIGTMHKDKNNR